MLHILALVITASLLLNPASLMAGFFEEEDTPLKDSECSKCKSDTFSLNPELKDKVSAIEKKIYNNLNKNTSGNEITLFIDLGDRSFDQAVISLIKFKNNNPSWAVKGVIIGGKNNLKEKLLMKQKFFGSGIEFNIDLSGSLAKEFNVLKAPVYLITYNGSQQKITSLPDFNDFISKIDK